MQTRTLFDGRALFEALDEARRERGLEWYPLAAELWHQSFALNAERGDHPLCGGALQRLATTKATDCQYALFALRWLGRAPEDFLVGPVGSVIDVGPTRLPEAGSGARLRWDLAATHSALDAQRRERQLTWVGLAAELDATPNRLTNLRTARRADLGLMLRVTQWLRRPAADFVHPATW